MRNTEKPPALDSVDRALQLVIMLRDGGAMSVKEAAERLGVAPSTAHRLLGTLMARKFAVQDRERRYRAGPEIIQATQMPYSLNTLRQVARPALERLNGEIRDTVQLMVLTGANIRFVDGIESEDVLRVTARIGDQMPAYCSAGGKAMLAELNNAELEQLHSNGLPPWPNARITSMAGLKRQLAAVRKNGYGSSAEETEQGVAGLGACIRDAMGKPVAAFTVAIPTVRFRKDATAFYVQALQSAAAAMEGLLRSGGPASGTRD